MPAEGFSVGAEREEMKDRACWRILLVVLLLMGYLTVFDVWQDGADISRVSHGIDWMGRVCGVDDEVASRPLLYFCVRGDQMANDGICVDSCPDKATTSHLCPGMPSFTNDKVQEYGGQYQAVTTIKRPVSKVADTMSVSVFNMFCLPSDYYDGISTNPQLNGVGQAVIMGFQGINDNWWYLLFLGMTTGVVSFLVIKVMNPSNVGSMMYVFLSIPFLIMVLLALFFLFGFANIGYNMFYPWASKINALLMSLASSLGVGAAAAGYAWWCHQNLAQIETSAEVIKAATGHMTKNGLAMIPWVQVIIELGVLLSIIDGLLDGVSKAAIISQQLDSGNAAGLTITGLGRTRQFEDWIWRLFVFWILGGAWIHKTVAGLAQFATAYALMEDTHKNSVMSKGFLMAVLHKAGTCAFGGFMTGVLGVLGGCLTAPYQRLLASPKQNTEVVIGVLKTIVQLSNHVTYVECAVHPGRSYAESAACVDDRLRRDANEKSGGKGKFGKANFVRKLLLFLKIGLPASGALLTYFNLERPPVQAIGSLTFLNISGTVVTSGMICFMFTSAFTTHFETVLITSIYKELSADQGFQL